MDWFDRAAEELDDAYERGEMTMKEYQAAMRELRLDLQGAAQEAAEEAYNATMGGE